MTYKVKWDLTPSEARERRSLQSEAQGAWRRDNRAYARDYYKANFAKLMWGRAKKRAAERGIEFDIAVSDIIIPTHCPVLGIPLVIGEGRRGPASSSPSLDRMHPELGYVRGNVTVISHRANIMKQDGTAEELRKVADWMDKNQF